MLRKCPQFKLPDLIDVFVDYKYLQIMVKNILKSKSGTAYVDKVKKPELVLLDYKVLTFIGGKHNHPLAPKLLKLIPENKLLIFPDEEWINYVEDKLILTTYARTSFSSEKLSIEKMDDLLKKDLPDGYTLHKINLRTLTSFNTKLAPAVMPFYRTPFEFVRKGLGYCIKESDFVISFAASAMPIIDNEFEIQVATDPDPKYRRKGFATKVCATLIKESLNKGITPHWDADNEIMVRLGLKLGFIKPQNYSAYICSRNPLKK